MKKLLVVVAAVLVSAGLFVVPAVAHTSHAPNVASGSFKDGPYSSTTQDSGTCGNNWAQDLFLRNFQVKLPANGDGTYTVTEKFSSGRFVTMAGDSPAGCDTGPGDQITEGIAGSFKGTFTITVSGGTFNPASACEYAPETDVTVAQCLTSGWVHGFFGDGATFEIPVFSFTYNAPSSLLYHTWTNANTGNSGDIATS